MSNTVNWLKSQKLTPIQLIYVFIAIFVFIFMSTHIFESFPDFLKAIFYGAVILVGVLLGVSLFNIKQIAADMKAIYLDTNMTLEQKINAYGNLALQVLLKLGEAFEELNTVQFNGYDPEKTQLENKIAELTKQIQELEKKE